MKIYLVNATINSKMKSISIFASLLFIATGALAQSKFSCADWTKLTTNQQQQVLERFIAGEKAQKVVLKLSADYYCREISELIGTYTETHNIEALDGSLGVTIHTIAAMEGDWHNGEPPLDHAKHWMGEKGFALFKERYPEKYRRLLKMSVP